MPSGDAMDSVGSVAKATDVNNRDDMIMNGFIRDIINSKSDLADILNDF